MLRARAGRFHALRAMAFALVCLAIPVPESWAQAPRSAAELYRSGEYEAAMNAGSTAGDGESLTNAALAGVAWASMREIGRAHV